MKIALCTTTIRVPDVLKLYRRCDDQVKFFIALDQNSAFEEIAKTCDWSDANMSWLTPHYQGQWSCSELIGWKNIQRRNIAMLEALKWGAEILVMVDDDNIPLNTGYFADYEIAMDPEGSFSGLLASPEVDWFDVGQFLDPISPHRGFPHQHVRKPRLSHVVDARIGAAAGIVLGDPDISAATRITNHPHVLNHSPLLNAGIAVNPRHTRTVWNTQNSAIIRELAPAMLLCPQFRRYDDIIASLVTQRIMCDTGHHVLFGPPFVYQERNAHDLNRDLDDEHWGQQNLLHIADMLNGLALKSRLRDVNDTVISKVEAIYSFLQELKCMPPGVAELAQAWARDCERAMG